MGAGALVVDGRRCPLHEPVMEQETVSLCRAARGVPAPRFAEVYPCVYSTQGLGKPGTVLVDSIVAALDLLHVHVVQTKPDARRLLRRLGGTRHSCEDLEVAPVATSELRHTVERLATWNPYQPLLFAFAALPADGVLSRLSNDVHNWQDAPPQSRSWIGGIEMLIVEAVSDDRERAIYGGDHEMVGNFVLGMLCNLRSAGARAREYTSDREYREDVGFADWF